MNIIQPTELTEHMRLAGITNFDGEEVLTLHNTRKRKLYNLARTPPLPGDLLPNVLALGRLLQRLRDDVGRPVKVLSWYRPEGYNAAVGGRPASRVNPGSAHLRAAGADIRIKGLGHDAANAAAYRAWHSNPRAAGYGMYMWGRIHLDVFHPGGKPARQWRSKWLPNVGPLTIKRK